MAQLVAIVYGDEFRAAEVLATLKRLQSEYMIDLEDACVVTRSQNGKVRLHQAVNLAGYGAATGALWGTIIGLIFLNPLLGLATGAIAGAIAGKLSDYGINDAFMRELAERMQNGSSAIFMLVRHATLDRVEPQIARFGGHILYTNLSAEMEAHYDKLLAQAFPSTSAAPRSHTDQTGLPREMPA